MTVGGVETGAGAELEASPGQRTGAIVRAHAVVLSAGIYLLLVLNFTILRLGGADELVQYGFVRRLFGDASTGSGYLFGLSVVEAPLYALGKLVGALGIRSVAGRPVTEAAIAGGLGLATLSLWPLLAPVLRGLELRRAGTALLAAAVGMPLLYYATIQPTKSHGLEAVLSAVAIALAFRLYRGVPTGRSVALLLGAVLGLLCTVRYFAGSEGIALVAVLLLQRRVRAAVMVSIGGIVAAGTLLLVPLSLGASLTVSEAAPRVSGGLSSRDVPLHFVPLTPVRMLFTNERGLFLWSPISVLAVVGLVLLYRSRARQRQFLTAVYAMGASVVLAYAATPWWMGGLSFSQRFFTPLAPLVVLGVAGVLDAWPRLGTALAAACASWTLFLMLNLITIGGPPLTGGGALELAHVPWKTHTSPGAYVWGVRNRSNALRWTTR